MKACWRWLKLVFFACCGLQLFFFLQITAMAWIAPQSTTFERSEIWRLSTRTTSSKPNASFNWRQNWRSYSQISDHLKRAVIASEDSSFTEHAGVDWRAIQQAWHKNSRPAASQTGKSSAKIVGGSTISQQLSKNLFLSGERTFLRKGQELVLTTMLETMLSKQRILEIYLNHVEWGEGIFGAQAAAQFYFAKPASQLSQLESARLAVMLPRPKFFAQKTNSNYIKTRASVIAERMHGVYLPE